METQLNQIRESLNKKLEEEVNKIINMYIEYFTNDTVHPSIKEDIFYIEQMIRERARSIVFNKIKAMVDC